MYQYEDVRIRKFKFEDIPLKIEWVNNPLNNKYLHYDLPLEYEKTCKWYENTKNRTDRFDAVIEYCGEPVGLAGLLNIDYKNSKAEDYILVGNVASKRSGVATKAGILTALYCFEVLKLNKLYAFIERGNPSLDLYLKKGFNVEGFLRNDLYNNGMFVDRYIVSVFKKNLTIPEGVYWEDEDVSNNNA